MKRSILLRKNLVAIAIGCQHSAICEDADMAIAPALRRAFAADVPYLVNVVTDPEVAYPRSTTGV